MSLLSKIQGRKGEERAARFLVGRGYKIKILDRTYRTPSGELDLIALHRGLWCS